MVAVAAMSLVELPVNVNTHIASPVAHTEMDVELSKNLERVTCHRVEEVFSFTRCHLCCTTRSGMVAHFLNSGTVSLHWYGMTDGSVSPTVHVVKWSHAK